MPGKKGLWWNPELSLTRQAWGAPTRPRAPPLPAVVGVTPRDKREIDRKKAELEQLGWCWAGGRGARPGATGCGSNKTNEIPQNTTEGWAPPRVGRISLFVWGHTHPSSGAVWAGQGRAGHGHRDRTPGRPPRGAPHPAPSPAAQPRRRPISAAAPRRGPRRRRREEAGTEGDERTCRRARPAKPGRASPAPALGLPAGSRASCQARRGPTHSPGSSR